MKQNLQITKCTISAIRILPSISQLCHDFFCLKIFVHSQHCIIHSLAIQFYFSYMVQAVLLLKSILRKSSFAYFLLIFILYTGILFPYYFIFAERSLVQIQQTISIYIIVHFHLNNLVFVCFNNQGIMLRTFLLQSGVMIGESVVP